MAQTKAQTVEAYLASLEADQRETLERVRRAIRAPASARQKVASAKLPHDVTEVLRELQLAASESYRTDMQARYGIVTQAIVYGTPVSQLRRIAKQLGKSHPLSRELWQTGVHDARMLATMVADPGGAHARRDEPLGAGGDPRNFVKKGVSWALRAIGSKKSPRLRKAARALAKKLAASSDATERWIGKDALRTFVRA